MIIENDKEMTFCICEDEPEVETVEDAEKSINLNSGLISANGGYMKWLLTGLGIGQNWSNRKFWIITCAVSGLLLGGCAVNSANMANIGYSTYINFADSFAMLAGMYFGIIGASIAAIMSLAFSFKISAVIAAFVGAIVYYVICDRKFPNWYQALPFVIVTECIAMEIFMLAGGNSMSTSVEILNYTAYWLFGLNGVFTTVIVLFISLANRKRIEKTYHKETGKRTYSISTTFRFTLAIVVIAVLVSAIFVDWSIQTRLAVENATNMLESSIQDIAASIEEQTDQQIIELANFAKSDYSFFSISQKNTDIIAKLLEIDEINVVNRRGIVEYSNIPSNIGYDMYSQPESAAFMWLSNDTASYVQPFRKSTLDESGAYIKYAGVSLWDGYFVQIGVVQKAVGDTMAKEIALAAHSRHVGTNGVFYITSEYGYIYSSTENVENCYLTEALGVQLPLREEGKVCTFDDGIQEYYYLFRETEGCKVIGVMSQSEVMESRDLSQWLIIVTQVIAFAILFVMISLVVRNMVVRQIKIFNDGLNEIAAGNLEVIIKPGTHKVREYYELADDVNDTVDKLKALITEAEERIEEDLNLAKDIQREALPSITNAFPKETAFSIHATMDPAKEVGGDFYDFYYTDSRKVAFLVADVSGKGIPAAMFMMKSKSIIKGYAKQDASVEDIIRQTNNELCAQNEAGMFVTCWMCIVDLETGNAEFCNAGHNPPLLRKADGTFEYVKSKVNLVLAAMDGVPYFKSELHLEPGDELFLYTDGVSEATNVENELYGEERLKDCLSRAYYDTPEEVCRSVKEDLDRFVGEADQFDDITMLSFKFRG